MPEDRVAWTHRPLAGRRGAKTFLVLLLGAAAMAVWYATGNLVPALAVIACVALIVAPAVAPTSYVLSEEAIKVRYLWRTVMHPWSAFRRLTIEENFLILSPFERPSFRDVLQGQYLRFGRPDAALRDAALRFALRHLPRRAEAD